MSDPVPAIAEAAATGTVAEIFSDIRRVLGVAVVNLIWRHLATIPDALPWAWGMLRPLYADGTIAAEAQTLHGRLSLPRLPPLPRELPAAIDLGDGDLASIRNVLAAGSLETAIADTLIKARAQATCLATRLRASAIDPTTAIAIRAAIEPFAGDVIAKMVVICALLRTATGP